MASFNHTNEVRITWGRALALVFFFYEHSTVWENIENGTHDILGKAGDMEHVSV